jgi:hypothetical protein
VDLGPRTAGRVRTHRSTRVFPSVQPGAEWARCGPVLPEHAAAHRATANVVTGTPGDDDLSGGPGPGIIDGRGGADTLRGLGDDVNDVDGRPDSDRVDNCELP